MRGGRCPQILVSEKRLDVLIVRNVRKHFVQSDRRNLAVESRLDSNLEVPCLRLEYLMLAKSAEMLSRV